MTALADDRQTPAQEVELKGYLVAASTTIYKGGMVAVNDAGHLVMASDAANLRVVGVADERVDNSAGSAGDKKCRVRSGRAFDFNATAITQAMVGDLMFVVDDNTFDDAAGTNGVPCGRLLEYISATRGIIYIPVGGLRKAGIAAAAYDATEAAMVNDLLN